MPSHKNIEGREGLRVVFLRSPRHYWPLLNESDNFLPALSYATLAGYLRREIPGLELHILDACAFQMGWKTFERRVAEMRPDVVCVGEKAIFAHEGMRVFEMVKRQNPDVITIAGGQIYTHVPEWTFESCPALDYLIRFEGERPLTALLRALLEGKSVSDVPNLCYVEGGEVVKNPLGDPIADLDTIPMPAYDLVRPENYQPFGRLFPRAIPVQRGRGCVDACSFCSWSALENLRVDNPDGSFTIRPRYRTKSIARMVEETELLTKTYGSVFLFFVDGSFNVDTEWLDGYSSELIRKQIESQWWAFARYDLLMQQQEAGVLDKMVQAGLRHCLFGFEREDPADLMTLGKSNYNRELAVKSLTMLKQKHPVVFRQGTILTGLRNDTPESIKSLLKFAHDCHLDFVAYHPITPFPGTPIYDEAARNGWLTEVDDFSKYDMFGPILQPEHMSLDEVAHWTAWCQKNFVAKKPWRFAGGLLSRFSRRRNMYWWFLRSLTRVMWWQAKEAMLGRRPFQGFSGVNQMWKPPWYDS